MSAIILAIAVALFPACATEDASNCYWDGGANGTGVSFVDINGTAYYTN